VIAAIAWIGENGWQFAILVAAFAIFAIGLPIAIFSIRNGMRDERQNEESQRAADAAARERAQWQRRNAQTEQERRQASEEAQRRAKAERVSQQLDAQRRAKAEHVMQQPDERCNPAEQETRRTNDAQARARRYEEQRQREEEQRKADEEKRLAEEAQVRNRQREEQRRREEEKQRADEEKRKLDEERQKAEEQRRRADEEAQARARIEEEQRKQAEERRRAEEQRESDEAAARATRLTDEKTHLDRAAHQLELAQNRGAIITSVIIFEMRLKSVVDTDSPDYSDQMSLAQMLYNARERRLLNEVLYARLRKVLDIRNRAAHEVADPTDKDARFVLDTIKDALDALPV
jgi:hypothetical protein